MIRYVLIPLLPLAASRLLLINQQKAKEKRINRREEKCMQIH